MGRWLKIVFSFIVLLAVVGAAFYFTMEAKKTAERYSEEVAQKHKRGVKDVPEAARPIYLALKKKSKFVECHNTLEHSRLSAIKRYASWLKDLKKGPTGRETQVHGIYKITGLRNCIKHLKEAGAINVQVKELNDLEMMMEKYIAGMKKFTVLVKQMHQYYRDEDFKDDKFAKAKIFHTQFESLRAKLDPMGSTLHRTLDHLEDQLRQRRLAYFKKKYGEKIRYLMVKTLAVNKKFYLLVERSEVDPARVEDGLRELKAVHKALSRHFSENTRNIKERVFRNDSFAFSRLETLVSKTREFISHGKKYVRGLRAALKSKWKLKRFLKNSRGTWGSATRILDTYNNRLARLRLIIPW